MKLKNDLKQNNSKINVNKKVFLLAFIIGFIITCPMLIPSYNLDGYCQLAFSHKEYGQIFFSGGRFISGIFWYIFDVIKIPNDILSIISVCLSNLFLSLAIVIAYKKIEKYISDKILNKIILFVGLFIYFYNPFLMEYFIYEESFAMCLAILLSVMAGIVCSNKNTKSFIYALILLICANFLYQGSLCIFIPFTLLISIFEDKDLKFGEFVKKNFVYYIKVGLCYGISLIVAFLSLKIYVILFNVESSKLGSVNILENIRLILSYIKYTYSSALTMINPTLFKIVVASLLLIIFIKFLFNRKDYYKYFIYIILIIIISCLICFVPNIVMVTEANYTAARLLAAVGSIVGFIVVTSLLFIDNINNKINNYYLLLILGVGTLYFIYNGYNYLKVFNYNNDRYNMDIDELNIIQNKITEYETKNNISINNIYYKKSKYSLYVYNTSYPSVFSYRILSTDWAFACGVNGVIAPKLNVQEMTDAEYEEYFTDKEELTKFTEDSFVFVDDALYILLY